MSRLVLDASVAMAWCYEDEDKVLADRLFESLAAGRTAIVPSIWAIEIANALVNGERRQRVTKYQVERFVAFLEALPIEVDTLAVTIALTQALDIARTYELTAYDACYLALAMREVLMLATLDTKLKAAAGQVGVAVFA